ncbi:MAG: CapA family protein [Candidatus Paceibacterota bacterium]
MKRVCIILAGLTVLAGLTYATVVGAPLVYRNTHATLTFTGDSMLDRYIRKTAAAREDGFSGIAIGFDDLFSRSDLVVSNLEGPVTSAASVSEHTTAGDANNMRFTFPPASLAFLSANSINLVSIGNNHITDFGPDGVRQTKQHLTDAGIAFVGDPYSTSATATTTINGVSLAFVSYNQFLGPSAEETVTAIERAGETADHTVVLAHWGEEYRTGPTPLQQRLAHRFIDAGATLVVGTHPHVVQNREHYNGGVIFYSLGNFVFDQYWHPAVRCGLVATVSLDTTALTDIATTTAWMRTDGTTVHTVCDPTITSPVLTP